MRFAAAASVVAACSGRALDVGGNPDAGGAVDAGLPGDATLPAIGSDPLPEAAPYELPSVGFTIEGAACTIAEETVNGYAWPTWTIAVLAVCGSSWFRLSVVSNATITYPQSCSIATEVTLSTVDAQDAATIEAGSVPPPDAGFALPWQANALRGSCEIMLGPTTASPSSDIALTAIVESLQNGALHVSYASRRRADRQTAVLHGPTNRRRASASRQRASRSSRSARLP